MRSVKWDKNEEARKKANGKNPKQKPYGARVLLNIPDFKALARKIEEDTPDIKNPKRPAKRVESLESLPDPPQPPLNNVENPWIADISSQKTLENSKGKPARHIQSVQHHGKIIPSKYNEASFRLDESELNHSEELQIPGTNPQKTKEILSREYANFEFPNLKSTKNISEFDCWREEKTPQEWVEFCQDKPGPHAMSPVYEKGSYNWEPVDVLSYNASEKKFLVKIRKTSQQKKVQRLALRFNDEEEANFEQRVTQARELQSNYEAHTRFIDYIDAISGGKISQMRDLLKNHIIRKAVATNKSFENEKYVPMLKNLMAVAEEEYARAMKKCIVLLKMQNPKYDEEFLQKKIKVRRETKVVPEIGTVAIPQHPFSKNRRKLEENHWYRIPEAVQVNKILSAKCHSFQDFRYLQTKDLETPMSLKNLYNVQRAHHQAIRQQISIQWREFIISETQDKMAEKFNFFAVDHDDYVQTGLHSLLKRMDYVMNTHVRNFIRNSIVDWVEFLQKFGEPQGSESYKKCSVPLVELELNMETRKKSKKKEKEVNEEIGKIDFKPTLEKTRSFIVEFIDWIVEAAAMITNLETDLVPFMKVPKTPVYEITQENEWVVSAKQKINEMVDEYFKGPQELLENHLKFEWLSKMKPSSYVKELFKEKPSIEALRAELKKFSDAEEELVTIATKEVNFDLIQVKCSKFKEKLQAQITKGMAKIFEMISKFCKEEVSAIHEDYEKIKTKIMTLPNNEDELFELKKFAKGIKAKKEELREREKDVINRTLILEDYGQHLEQETTYMLWYCKTCPVEVDVASREGNNQLQREEEKFREKLEKEKEEWYKEIQSLHSDFEKVQQFSDLNDASDNFNFVKNLEENLKNSMEKLKSFNQRETLFELQLSDKSELQGMIDEFDPFNKLWTNANNFKDNSSIWVNEKKLSDMNSKDADEIASSIDRWSKDCAILKKKLLEKSPEAVSAIDTLKENLNEFQEYVPLVKAIANEAWNEDHWKKLYSIASTPDEEQDPKHETVMSLVSKKMNNYIEEIQEISHRAQREFKLKQTLERMKKEAEAQVLPVIPYKDTYIIETVEDLQAILDEQITSVQAMKSSPYAKPIERQCREWEQRLLHIQETLDLWIKFQGAWMSLKPIFSSDDIMKHMPAETRMFRQVDLSWNMQMESTSKDSAVLEAVAIDGSTLNLFKDANKTLEEIQKSMHNYLESKRLAFPRFFFLSDEDLLDILSQTKDPLKVQDHLNKCFEAIDKVVFTEKMEVTHMVSPEKETIELIEKIDVNEGERKGNVEFWMGDIEKTMYKTIKDITKKSYKEYFQIKRTDWIRNWPSMVILVVDQIIWTHGVEEAIKNNSLSKYEKELTSEIMDIVAIVRGKHDRLTRQTLSAALTIDVHARDIVTDLKKKQVSDFYQFDWIAQLRYYWGDNSDISVRMVNSSIRFGFEYLGNTPRLVITPLTDRCYRTLIGAYNLFYGGGPEGPAGTGKTESVKDLAKAVAVKCVVFNCSDTLDYAAMAKFFKGLASSGSWCCFDEFNRIEAEVLSVVAMQILQIQQAIRERKKIFVFEGTSLPLVHSCAINITMNPGYAGRSELPDNLKALFRPCAMMVPDYALISEISLFSYGFENARSIATKVTASLRLSSEQLSTQGHYDFGMRAVKAILTACGNLKIRYPEENEDILALRALNDVNLPKFTSNDIPLFLGITSDLFPGVELTPIDYGALLTGIEEACQIQNLQPTEEFKSKCIQLYETITVRHGLMLVGQTFSGKSKVISTLQMAISSVKDNPNFANVQKITLNPKSITTNQLYGRWIAESHQWYDGVISTTFRHFTGDKSDDKKWVVFDGPVDSKWIENMNTVLDDNKMLCLTSGETIKLTETMTMMFEVEDLKEASPATVSRCGMVFLEPHRLGWEVLVQSYAASLPKYLSDKYKEYIIDIYWWFCWPLIEYVRKNCKLPVPVTELELVSTALNILDCFLGDYKALGETDIDESPEKKKEVKLPSELDEQMSNFVLFSIIWGIGGATDETTRSKFGEFLKELIEGQNVKENHKLLDTPENWEPRSYSFKLPSSFFEVTYLKKGGSYNWTVWTNLNPSSYMPSKTAEFHEITVPTKDTARISYLMKLLSDNKKHILFSGPTGTGKTVCVLEKLRDEYYNETWTYLFMAFSAQTSANKIQMMMESVMEKKSRKVHAPAGNKKMIIFVDDLNMPEKEEYGAQPPIEILRQWMDYFGWYELGTNEFMTYKDIQFAASMGPPGGGRNHITQRYLRHFNKFYIEPFDQESQELIFTTIVDWWFAKQDEPFSRAVVGLKDNLVSATIHVFNRITKELLPTPAKIHYLYNLRDVSKVFQGLSRSTSLAVKEEVSLVKLWAHECKRVFEDRLINYQDREYFENLLKESTKTYFKREWEDVVTVEPLMFGSFIPMISREEGKPKIPDLYCELSDHDLLREKMDEFLDYYNQTNSTKMNLVLFMAAIEHVVKIVRIITQPMGNALLLGVGGSGRKSLTMLATCIAEYSLFEIEVSKNFGMTDWRDKIKELFFKVGLENNATVFMFPDTQISNEGFLEDVNNLLNNGEVPNLFENEDKQKILDELQDEAMQVKQVTTAEGIYAYFIERVRSNLHIVLCLSPIGESFRTRLRKFPSLVNCCTIDWFLPWPEEALNSVAEYYMTNIDVDEKTKKGLVEMCVSMQKKVTVITERYREELRRHYYITPTSYLELIGTFQNLINTKRVQLTKNIARYEGGLEKLFSTGEKVKVMEQELEELKPQLEQQQKENNILKEDLTQKQKEAQVVRAACEEDEAKCEKDREEAASIAAECEQKLSEAMPIYEKAVKAVKQLDKSKIDELKGMKGVPPKGVTLTMEALSKLFGLSPIMVNKQSGFGKEPDWLETARKNILNRSNLMNDLIHFDKDNIDPNVISSLEKMIKNPEFEEKKIERSSKAAYCMSQWVRAIYNYDDVMKVIRPKQAALAEAQGKLKKAEEELKEKRENLQKQEDYIAKLEADYQEAIQKEQELQNNVDTCRIKLERAGKLINGLKDEKGRWEEEAANLKEKAVNIVGDLVISSGIVAYLGVFTGHYRSDCIEEWVRKLKEKEIPSSGEFSLQAVLGEPVKIQDWTMASLPNDSFSIDNAIIQDISSRWPLMIDPQMQANNWIKKMEGERLDITKLHNENLSNLLVNALNFGKAVLIENMGESINPELDGLLSMKKGQEASVKIGDKLADMSKDFRLYMTTKLPRPHYPPEICVRVSLLNFMTTQEGLLDQMLAFTVNKIEPHMEAQRQKSIRESAEGAKKLKELEDMILNLVSSSEGDILEDETLIEALEKSKQTSKEIHDQLRQQENLMKNVKETRKLYTPSAFRVSQLFFCIADLCMIEPMYQYSLEWYERIYSLAIQEELEKSTTKNERVRNLITTFTLLLYQNVCRSLFEKDKLLFSFQVCTKIMQSEDRIDPKELRFLMTGGTKSQIDSPNPTQEEDRTWLENKDWAAILELSEMPSFDTFDIDFKNYVTEWKEMWESSDPLEHSWPGGWKNKLSKFQQLLVLRIIRPDKVVSSIEKLIVEELSSDFISPPPFDLELSFKDSENNVPIIFVLSPGVDPISEVEKLAAKMSMKHRMEAISLGDGQGVKAEAALDRAIGEGGWVVLQNCHLASSWMPTLEKRVDEIDPETTSPEFRLWLTSMPDEKFPVSILQNSIKLTNEPPKGLKKNLIRSYLTFDKNAFEDNQKPMEFKRLVYGLSFFHALIQERRKFGALGWNIPYEFSMPDLSISFYQLRMFLNEYEQIPWDALRYMVAEANYGGRVTDAWDRRTINTILKDFYTEKVLTDAYVINDCSEYKMPPEGVVEDYVEFITKSIPHYDKTEVFGLHENASITSAIQETNQLLSTCLSLLPRTAGSQEKTSEQIMTEIAVDIYNKMPNLFDVEEASKRYKIVYEESMNTVLIQELIRFNNLLKVIRTSTIQLKDALAGLVTMSADLEKVGNALFDNKVPELWSRNAYPSLKPLAQWVEDFIARLEFMQKWLDEGPPNCFWISGFFFTQSFLTGTLQNYSRKYKIPIDTLCFDFEVLSETLTPDSFTSGPEDGCYVHGLFLDGARWDDSLKALAEPLPKILFYAVPVIWLKPVKISEKPKKHTYECPVYKTSTRQGTLSTTGHSTNFVLSILLDIQPEHDSSHWIKRGAALLTQLDY